MCLCVAVFILHSSIVSLLYYSTATCEVLRTCMDPRYTNTILTDQLIPPKSDQFRYFADGWKEAPRHIYLHPQVPGSLQKEFLAQVVAQTHATLGHCTHISIIAISVSVPHDAPAAPLANTFSQLLRSPGDYWG